MNPKQLLDDFGVLPKKALGQNFLHDPNALEKIAATAELMPDDTVLEIGPGTGALTEVLAQYARRVVSVELDERLAPILDARLSQYPNVEVVYDDFLATYIPALVGNDPYVVVANVPYYISSAILRHLFASEKKPRRIVLTMQLEVAERLIAKPGDLSLLGVSAQYYGKPRIISKFPPAVFYPRPEVYSAIVRIDMYETPPVDAPEDVFFTVARAGFSQKRKQLKNSVGSGLNLPAADAALLITQAGIDPQRRPETLTLQEWAALARVYAATVKT